MLEFIHNFYGTVGNPVLATLELVALAATLVIVLAFVALNVRKRFKKKNAQDNAEQSNGESQYRLYDSFNTLIFGVVVTLALALAIAMFINPLFNTFFPESRYTTGMFRLVALFCAGLTISSPVFLIGLIKTDVAHHSVLKRFQKRTGSVIDEGWGWILWPIYTRQEESAKDNEVDVGERHFLSMDNVPVIADVAVIIGVKNAAGPLSFDGDIYEYVKNLAEEGTRRYILNHPAMSTTIFRGNTLTPEAMEENQRAMAGFKDDVERNGREFVREQINNGIQKYQLYAARVVIENVRLPEDIEEAGGEKLREMLESSGDDVDWRNTQSLATSAINEMIDRGFKYSELRPTEQLGLEQTMLDQVLSKKKQASRISIGGGNALTAAAAILSNDKSGGDK